MTGYSALKETVLFVLSALLPLKDPPFTFLTSVGNVPPSLDTKSMGDF